MVMNLLREGKIFDMLENGELPKDQGKILYHTCRDVENDEDEETGIIRVLTLKEDEVARTEYVCPECNHHAYLEKEWKRPFSVKCEECGNRIKVPRIKDKMKRKRKKRTKEK